MSSQRRPLGRGLSALFDTPAGAALAAAAEAEEGEGHVGDEEGGAVAAPRAGVMMQAVARLHPSGIQPRQHFDEEALDDLAKSLEAHGVLQPLIIRPHPDVPNEFEIVAGERRWRAAQRAQLHEVPVILRDLTDADALELALIENIQRSDLSAIDEAQAYNRLIEEFGHTQEALARGVGKSRSHVANLLRLLTLPEDLQAMVRDGRLSAGHARALLSAEDPEALAQEILSKGLSVREVERRVAQARSGDGERQRRPRAGSVSRETAETAAKDPDLIALEQDLTSQLGLAVTVSPKESGGGTVNIRYQDLDQLDDLLQRLSQSPI